MSFDLEKLQAVAELGDVIRLQNEALENLQAFRKARPHLMMPNLAKIVEENLKENVMILYKELNNLHKPAEKQTRYICNECKMAFLVPLPGGICDECRARKAGGGPREYVPYQGKDGGDEEAAAPDKEVAEDAEDNEAGKKDEAAENDKSAPGDFNIEDAYAKAIAEENADNANSVDSAVNKPADEDDDAITVTLEAEGDEGEQEDAVPEKRQPASDEGAAGDEDATGDEEPDDNYDNPGDEIELANPATDVAKPENVEGIPDIDSDGGAADERRS